MRGITYANVTATLALFLALGGTSYAALTITGKNVKNGSLTGQDVRDGSLAKRDLSARTRRALAGSTGPKGDTGSPGAVGPKGGTGFPGAVGPKGDTGFPGAVGPKGDTGFPGAVGPKGDTGSPGAVGPKGDTGFPGAVGPKGDTGSAGPAGIVGATQFQLGSIVSQPNGVNRTVITTTGLSPGNYLVMFSLLMTNPQRYTCGIQHGSTSGSYGVVVRRMIDSGGNPEEFQGFGTMSVGASTPILTCMGFTADWSASNIDLQFIKLDSVTNGVEG